MNKAGPPRGPIRLLSAYGVLLAGTMAGIYLVSQILRNSIGVIAPDLSAEIGLSAAQVGFLSSAFFIAFSLAQVPLGIAIDRYGPKRCMLVCAAILVAGAAMFAAATTPSGLIAARFMIGLGSCCYLMAPLAFYARHFPPDRFSTLAGLQIGLGTIGTMIATAPLAISAASIGWRATFLVITAAVAVAGLMVALVLPAERGATPAGRESLRDGVAGLVAAARSPHVMPLFLMHAMSYSSFVLVVGLWGGPYLAHVYGYGLAERGEFLFLAAAAQTVGLFLVGPLEHLLASIKRPVMLGAGLTAAMLLLAALAGVMAPWMVVVWLLLFGFVAAYNPTLIAHGKSLFAPEVLGRGMTLLNIGSMAGVFVSQAITGAVIGLFPAGQDGAYPLAAYQTAFALQGLCGIVALLVYCRLPEPRRD